MFFIYQNANDIMKQQVNYLCETASFLFENGLRFRRQVYLRQTNLNVTPITKILRLKNDLYSQKTFEI